jgi:hypothetical protein
VYEENIWKQMCFQGNSNGKQYEYRIVVLVGGMRKKEFHKIPGCIMLLTAVKNTKISSRQLPESTDDDDKM